MVRFRSIPVAIILTIVTCGIYGLFWFLSLADDVNAVSLRQGPTGGMVLLYTILTCGIYGYFWAWGAGDRLDELRARNGMPTGSFAILFLILNLCGLSIVTWALAQNEINRYAPPPPATSAY